MRLALLVVVLAGACGDNVHVDDVLEATSGSRIKLEWHLYEDGTRQAERAVFYDINVHARCTPQRWVDDVIRCVPIAEDAVYIDETCENLVGRGRTIEKPTHFIGHDTLAGATLPARLYRAGQVTEPVERFYEQRDGECVGPFLNPPDLTYYALVDEIAGSSLVEMRDEEVGDGRLGVRLRATDDGLRVPVALRDRDLDLPCIPVPRSDGSVHCAPSEVSNATLFGDPACEDPVIIISEAVAVPTLARVADPGGCARYHAVGAEQTGPLYRRDGGACTRVAPIPPSRAFAVSGEIELPVLERAIEDVPARRLQRIVLHAGDLRFIDERLHDTATRADCQRQSLGETVRCLPAVLASASMLFTRSCAVEVPIAEIPQATCERIGFAIANTDVGVAIHAVGDRQSDPLFALTGGGCQPYAGAPGNELRTLGPAIALETFSSAVSYGER